ncbi:MAG: pantoate--beta-alanine ligase [Bythopirellula sp.]|nr:pantoate--beta-alanine ligase [Bythopirellula sp.]
MAEIETNMRVVTTIDEVRQAVIAAQRAGETVGFVPTMGALHAGHLSLVDAAQAECDRTVVSIFVNPTQFGPGEDQERYPRTLEKDCELLAQHGCWIVFAPPAEEVYPAGHETFVEVGPVAEPLEGKIRPGHFRGVATVVLKLFQMVPADRAYFGRKDYQQSLVVERMIADFNLPIELVVCPTVREADGLALSSRNAYLNPPERQQAASLWKSLQLADSLHQQGESDVAQIIAQMLACLFAAGITQIDYIAFLTPGTVEPVTNITGPTVLALAARVGQARLIDNHTIG